MDTVHECDRQTDGRTDGRTDRTTITDTVQTASHGNEVKNNNPQKMPGLSHIDRRPAVLRRLSERAVKFQSINAVHSSV